MPLNIFGTTVSVQHLYVHVYTTRNQQLPYFLDTLIIGYKMLIHQYVHKGVMTEYFLKFSLLN